MEAVLQREFRREFTVDAEQVYRVMQGVDKKDIPSTFTNLRESHRASEENKIFTKRVEGRSYDNF